MTLPKKWKIVSLADLAKKEPYSIVDGPFGSNLKISDYVADGIPVLQGKNITGNKFQWFDIRFITQEKADDLKRSLVRVGDILIVKIGSIGYSARIDDLKGYPCALIPANLCKLSPNLNLVDPSYLCYFLSSDESVNYLKANASATSQPALSLEKVKLLPVLLPPLPEQQRIAAILQKADRLRHLRRHARQLSDTYLQTVFLEMFGDPLLNKNDYDFYELGNLIDRIDSGWSPVCEEFPADNESWGVLKLSAVTSGVYVEGENKKLPDGIIPKTNIEVHQGDVLITRKNTSELVAACVYVFKTRPRLLLSDTIFRFLISRTDLMTPTYLWQLFSQKTFRKSVQSLATGSSGSMPNISKEKFMEIRFPVPPKSLQDKFEKIVFEHHRLTVNQEESERQTEQLFQSLLHRAFQGEL